MIQWMEEGKSRLSQGRKALLFFPNVSIGVVKGGRWALTLKWGCTVVKRRNGLWWAHITYTRSTRPAHSGNWKFTYSQLSESTRTKGRADTCTRSVQQSALLRSESTTSLAKCDTFNRKQRVGAVRNATTDEDRVPARHRDRPQTIIKRQGSARRGKPKPCMLGGGSGHTSTVQAPELSPTQL